MMAGLFVLISRQNLVKKLVGLSIFQTSVFLFYITLGKMAGGTAPILIDDPSAIYSNPLPHVLILTAIVVGVATTALGLALVLRINEAFGSIEEDVLLAAKAEAALERPNRRRTAIKDSKQNDS
jgi:multicomponent Na+:H+ antiporter subunit C